MADRPLILVDPLPRTLDVICEPDVRKRLEALGRLVIAEDRQMPDEMVDRLLPDAAILIGQTAMPKERIDRAPKLLRVNELKVRVMNVTQPKDLLATMIVSGFIRPAKTKA